MERGRAVVAVAIGEISEGVWLVGFIRGRDVGDVVRLVWHSKKGQWIHKKSLGKDLRLKVVMSAHAGKSHCGWSCVAGPTT